MLIHAKIFYNPDKFQAPSANILYKIWCILFSLFISILIDIFLQVKDLNFQIYIDRTIGISLKV